MSLQRGNRYEVIRDCSSLCFGRLLVDYCQKKKKKESKWATFYCYSIHICYNNQCKIIQNNANHILFRDMLIFENFKCGNFLLQIYINLKQEIRNLEKTFEFVKSMCLIL